MTPSRSPGSPSPGGRPAGRASTRVPRASDPDALNPASSVIPSYAEEELAPRDLRHYLYVLRRRVRVIAGMTILVTLFAIVFSLLQDNVYRATAQVLLNRQNLPAAVTGRT